MIFFGNSHLLFSKKIQYGHAGTTTRRPEADEPSMISRLVKIAIAIMIFSAASYGEGWVNYMALVALFLVYLVAIG